VTTLWRLAWNDDRLSCSVYRTDTGMELRLESPAATIMNQPFDLEPRSVARARALRDSLKRRGWRDIDGAEGE
jgi:hypothetical protein